jgi:Flp pilus assembly protein TadD
VRIWETVCQHAPQVLRGHAGLVNAVAFHPTRPYLASGSDDRTVKLWDLDTARTICTLSGHTGPVTGVAFSRDGQRLVSTSKDQTVRLWDPESGHPIRILGGHAGAVTAVAFHPDGRRLASACDDGTVTVWDGQTGSAFVAVEAGRGSRIRIAFSPDGQQLAACGGDQALRLWTLTEGWGQEAVRSSVRILRGHTGRVLDLTYSADGHRLASASSDSTVKIWDTASGNEVMTLRAHPGPVYTVAFSPDGQRLASVFVQVKVMDAAVPGGPAFGPPALDAQQRLLAWHRREAASAEGSGDWFAAAFHLNSLIATQPPDWDAFARRGRSNAALGRDELAATDLARAVELGADRQEVWYHQALVHLRRGDIRSYRTTCADVDQRFGQTNDPKVLDTLAWVCALGPGGAVDSTRPVKLAERAVAGAPGTAAYLNTLGAALCRTGRFSEAVGRLNEAVKQHGNGGTAHDWFFLAIAHHHLGQGPEARAWLARATEAVDRASGRSAADASLSWTEALELKLLRREAEALMAP